jgi:hypothetical protein
MDIACRFASQPVTRPIPPEAPASGPLAGLTDQRLHRFHAYLEGKRGTREFAARRDLDPLDFPYLLGNIALLDVVGEPPRFRYRLVGSNLSAGNGYDLTGSFIEDHPGPEYRDYVMAKYRETVMRRCVTSGSYDRVMDGKLRRYQCLRVPLSDDGQTINMIIAAIALGTLPL